MSTKQTNTQAELVQGVLNHGPSILDHCIYDNHVDIERYLDRVVKEHLAYPIPKQTFNKENWFIPDLYKDMVIESWLLYQCKTQEQRNRVNLELELYKKHGMIPVLNTMKYVVDTLRKNNIVWGVGRGSSVASYVLHIIGVHKIDSIKYNIPIEEFFKGDQNG